MRAQRFSSIACSVALLAGCSSGDGHVLPQASGNDVGALTIRIRVPQPHHRKRSRYVSADTKGLSLAFSGPTALSETVGLTPTSPGCSKSRGATTCTVKVRLAPGKYRATMNAYDAVVCGATSCTIPSTAHLLSAASKVPLKVKRGKANSLRVTLAGVVASLLMTDVPSGTFGTPIAAQAFNVFGLDPDGNLIVGPYENPVTMSSNNSAVTIASSGSDNPPPGVLTSSTDAAKLSYTGAAIFPATITASAARATAANATFTVSHVVTVTLDTDTQAGTPPGTGTGSSGDLRYAMLNAPAGYAIIFDTHAMCGATHCTITLSGPLPPIVHNQTIEGSTFGSVIIDGAGKYRAFFADTGTIAIAHLQIQNAMAKGGDGGGGGYEGGGGGAGLGAGLFVNNAAAHVTVSNDYFLNDAAQGGAGGGAYSADDIGGGGGGLGGAGGGDGGTVGGGGGGVLGAGNTGGVGNGGIGGGGGGGAVLPDVAGTGASGYATNSGGGTGDHYGNAGNGGFGGGGGGSSSTAAGHGGFGAGGGGGNSGGGAGGSGGGSGGVLSGSAASGGSLGSSVKGGTGGSNSGGSAGGGGAAAGPAIFVNAGTLTTTASGASGSAATGGQPGSSGAGAGTAGTANGTPVFNYGGTVNGSTTKGPISSALGTAPP